MRRGFFMSATLLASAILTVAHGSSPGLAPLFEVTLDIDHDGQPDRAVLTESADGDTTDLAIFLSADRQPFVKLAVIAGEANGMERTGKSSLVIKSGYNLHASTWDETLTIVYRGGQFMVAGFTREWDWNVRTSDSAVETAMGGCAINYLTGKGRASDGLEDSKPVKGKFKPVRLADWSAGTLPQICTFER